VPLSNGVDAGAAITALQSLAGFAAARNATFASPAALLASPIAAVCSALSFTVPVAGPFDRIAISEDMGAGQVRIL
jgi:hypothetical protein